MLLIGPLLTLAVVFLALAFGGRAEREAAVLAAAVLLIAFLLGVLLGSTTQLPAALADLVLLAGFVGLAVRHRRLWLYLEVAVAVALVIAQVLCDDPLDPTPGFRALVNVLNLVATTLMLLATATTALRAARRPLPTLAA